MEVTQKRIVVPAMARPAGVLRHQCLPVRYAGAETLADIKLVVDLPAPGRRDCPVLRITERTADQDTLFQHFDLAVYHTVLMH